MALSSAVIGNIPKMWDSALVASLIYVLGGKK